MIFLDLFQMTDVENCLYNLTSPSDTFSSNNDASMYSSFIDCRWAIHAENLSQVRLTFVYFDTEKDYDYVTVNILPYSVIKKSSSCSSSLNYLYFMIDTLLFIRFMMDRPSILLSFWSYQEK